MYMENKELFFESKIKNVLDYIQLMKETRKDCIEMVLSRHQSNMSRSDCYSYGYDKGSLSELEFIENLLSYE